jgi:hypothetical protein
MQHSYTMIIRLEDYRAYVLLSLLLLPHTATHSAARVFNAYKYRRPAYYYRLYQDNIRITVICMIIINDGCANQFISAQSIQQREVSPSLNRRGVEDFILCIILCLYILPRLLIVKSGMRMGGQASELPFKMALD